MNVSTTTCVDNHEVANGVIRINSDDLNGGGQFDVV